MLQPKKTVKKSTSTAKEKKNLKDATEMKNMRPVFKGPNSQLPMPKNLSGNAKNGKSFPDLNKDGKITKADILKGRGVIAKNGATMKKQAAVAIAMKKAGKTPKKMQYGGKAASMAPKAKNGMHMMDGKMMKNSAMKMGGSMMKAGGKMKKGGMMKKKCDSCK